ncbi:hypothetical protein HSBAA_18350 [Vreelandella sulfidaeris]|uniref:Uncharacterized protein n=1 Tax=Vreelandella sulfidaeris TaxID=115553 RepID=A0A455U6R8_9GAMM|nr:hypothetical protein HSBAA_18350 [Halomonas sulfidaeris]
MVRIVRPIPQRPFIDGLLPLPVSQTARCCDGAVSGSQAGSRVATLFSPKSCHSVKEHLGYAYRAVMRSGNYPTLDRTSLMRPI